MSFDEQPDGDIHGECANEIHRLAAENAELKGTLAETYMVGPMLWENPSVPRSGWMFRLETKTPYVLENNHARNGNSRKTGCLILAYQASP